MVGTLLQLLELSRGYDKNTNHGGVSVTSKPISNKNPSLLFSHISGLTFGIPGSKLGVNPNKSRGRVLLVHYSSATARRVVSGGVEVCK